MRSSLQAVHSRREERRSGSLLDRIERLISKLEALAEDAATTGKASQLLAASRELRESYRLVGKLTGELDERPQVLNVLVSPEWQVRAAIASSACGPRRPSAAASKAWSTSDRQRLMAALKRCFFVPNKRKT